MLQLILLYFIYAPAVDKASKADEGVAPGKNEVGTAGTEIEVVYPIAVVRSAAIVAAEYELYH